MNDYLIGAGAVLTAGPQASIASATVHAQTEPALAASVHAALIDFESTTKAELTKVVVLASGSNGGQVQRGIVAPLLERRECSLADVLVALATAAGTKEVHIFAQWLADDATTKAASDAGVTIVTHPLEAIRQAALISGQRFSRWPSPLRAA